jgi:putative phage-type endonuclease
MMIHVEQNTPEWFMARAGKITASGMNAVMAKGEGKTRRKYMLKLISERFFGALPQETYTNEAIEHGKEQEKYARVAYETHLGKFVENGNWWVHDSLPNLGASPDGLVGDDGLIEIKCPNTETHLEYLLDNKVPSTYIKQIQTQLWVTDRKWCDFVSYDSRLAKKDLFVIKVFRDEELIAQMYDAVKEFEYDLLRLTMEMDNHA